jgi:hypothetical protein
MKLVRHRKVNNTCSCLHSEATQVDVIEVEGRMWSLGGEGGRERLDNI